MSRPPKMTLEHNPPLEVLAADMDRFIHNPLGWVYYAFPWEEEGELKEYEGPDYWQVEVLEYIGKKLTAKEITPNEAVSAVIRVATSAGNGPGKSAMVSWLILWAMSTFEDTRGVITANTDTQLRTKTWAELAKWYRLCITKPWFQLTATAIYAKDKEHERTWRIDQVPWSEDRIEAFSGLHNKGKRILLVFDEASAIPDKIWEVAEGALTDKKTEIIWLVSGNPTRNTGRFRECWGKARHRWKTWQIDTRKSRLTNQTEIKAWIEDLGIDSDWVRVHVLGKFPNASDLQFISNAIAEAAAARKLSQHQYFYAPKIIGLDPAWTGGDEIVIVLRQGLASKILQVFQRNDDDSEIAGALARHEDREKADGVFIDQGYGTGIYSFGKTLKRQWVLVNFGSKSNTPGFANKRAEIWGKLKEWLKEGGSVENTQKMIADLTAPEYHINIRDCIVLESKENMRKRGLASPGRADALALTFAHPVAKKRLNAMGQEQGNFAKHEYDVLAM
jgi:hypothetical protein